MQHIPRYREVFAIPGLLAEPMFMFGYQDIEIPSFLRQPFYRWKFWRPPEAYRLAFQIIRQGCPLSLPKDYDFPDLPTFLRALGITSIDIADFFDERASLKLDMNLPVDRQYLGRYQSFIDIGCLEHLFDTRQCIENCLGMVRMGGYYFLQTPVSGYLGHGFHTFAVEALVSVVEQNGFAIKYFKFTDSRGRVISGPRRNVDALVWLVAQKTQPLDHFVVPQQGTWPSFYARLRKTIVDTNSSTGNSIT